MKWTWCLLGCVGLVVVGCVPHGVHEQTRLELEKAKVANADLVRKFNQAAGRLGALEARLEGGDPAPLLARVQQLEADKEKLQQALSARPAGFTEKDFRDVPGAVPDLQGGMALGEALLFDEGSNRLKPEASRTLDQLAQLLRARYPGERIIIEGNTDNQELQKTRERWKYNMRLGYERAHAVFEYLVSKGIPESGLFIHANSFNAPLDPATESTEEGRRLNRRVVLRRAGAKL